MRQGNMLPHVAFELLCVEVFMAGEGQSDDMWLLNKRERYSLQQPDLDYVHMFQTKPDEDRDLVYFLGDRYEWGRTWSAKSGKILTYRRNEGFHFHRATRRKGTKPLPILDIHRSSALVGNSMHLTQVAVVMLIALRCFGPQQPGELLGGPIPEFQVV